MDWDDEISGFAFSCKPAGWSVLACTTNTLLCLSTITLKGKTIVKAMAPPCAATGSPSNNPGEGQSARELFIASLSSCWALLSSQRSKMVLPTCLFAVGKGLPLGILQIQSTLDISCTTSLASVLYLRINSALLTRTLRPLRGHPTLVAPIACLCHLFIVSLTYKLLPSLSPPPPTPPPPTSPPLSL